MSLAEVMSLFGVNLNDQFLTWLLYEVVLPLLPVLLIYTGTWMFGQARLFAVIRDGQLCFYCTTIVAVLLRDLVKKNTAIASLVAVLVILMIFTTFIYGAAVLVERKPGDEKKMGWTSILTCIATVLLVLFVRSRNSLF